MKNIIIVSIYLFCLFSLSAQTIITNATFPKVGDTLKTVVNSNFSGNLEIGTTGGPKNWDFSTFTSGVKQQEIYLNPVSGNDASAFPDANLMILSNGQEIYIKSSATKLEGLGFGGANQFFDAPIVVKYNKIPVLKTAPLEFINSNSTLGEFRIDLSASIIPETLLTNFPLKPDSIRIQFSNSVKGLTDAYGSLKLQGQTFDVLREKVENISQTQLFVKILGIWIDPIPLLGGNIPGGFGDFLGQDTTITYNFLSNAKKEILVSIDYNTSNELQSVTFADLGGVITSTKQSPDEPFTIYPNPASDILKFKSSDLKEGKYFITISDINGKVVYFEKAMLSQGENKQINTSFLPDGHYVLSLRNQFNTYFKSAKFIIRK